MTTEAAVEEADAGSAHCVDSRVPEGTRDRAWDVIDAIHGEAARIREREVDEAVRRLEARGDLTERQRDIVESMASDIFDRLLEPATKQLMTAAVDDEPFTIDTARRMFDIDVDVDVDVDPGGDAANAPHASGSTVTEVASDDD